MMNYQKSMSILLCAAIVASGLTACGNSMAEKDYAAANIASSDAKASQTEIADDKELSIVCTIFPEYDWVKQILGDHAEHAEITYLLDSGVDLHSYQPTALDMAKIAECDLFVYVGGESDEWVEDALADAVNPDMQVINLMEVMGDAAKEEEVKEGMEHDHDHEHEHAEIEEDDIQDRELTDFAGNWQSLYPLLEAGDLAEYVEHHAEEHDEPADEVLEELAEKWGCDVTAISIDGAKIDFTYADGTKKSGEYKYAGYSPVLADDGDVKAVLYQYERESGESPKYVMFNDHGFEPSKAEHFHIFYGDGTDFETTKKDFKYTPYFIPDGLNGEEAVEMLEGHNHSKTEEHEHEEGEVEYDEHVWLSLKNAKTFCTEIADKLSILDSANKDDYKANLDAYTAQLDTLDGEFKTLTDGAKQKTLVFGDRFPFRYFVDDYGLDYYAAFVGCSAETEASFETVVFLAEKMDELGCGTIFTIEHSDRKIAQTIIDNTEAKNQKIAEMNSLQSVTKDQLDSGVTYLSLMQANYDTLKGALQ